MKNFKFSFLPILILCLFVACTRAQNNKSKTGNKTPIVQTNPVNNSANDFKIIAQGNYSKAAEPFIITARDAETYALIRASVEGLPPSSTVDFKNSIVVAIFAGEKRTGGYSVKLRAKEKSIAVELTSPQPGDMTTQVITSPFQVVAIPLADFQAAALELPAEWMKGVQTYRVSKGDFQSTGGITGSVKKTSLEGTVGVWQRGETVTLFFNLSGKKKDVALKLADTATGVVKNGSVEIKMLDAGNLVENPHPFLKANGTLDNKKISLNLESYPPTVSDGYTGIGKIEAVKN